MSGLYEPLEPARLVRDPSGTPYSEQYHDVYHARQGAQAQARHVFLEGNGLPQRWRGREAFTVCETGFGLGRNFLALWQAWREDPQRSPRLHVLAFEAHPFSRAALVQANAEMPGVSGALARQLEAAWPELLPGMHRLEFESGAVTLTLAFGRIERMAAQVQAGVDAFFLDGFAPRLNPQMWTPALFGQMVRIARPGASVATWCTAGRVRRDLRDAGFLVSAAPGFGGRREMTTAVLRPGLGRSDARERQAAVLVVGAGPAGASVARRLADQGLDVTVADPVLAHGLGAAHGGHRAVAVTPLLSQDDDARARLTRAGVLRALQRWQPLGAAARPWRCGSFVIPKNADQAQRQQAALACLRLPEEWVCWQTPEQVAARLGRVPARAGLWFGSGQLVRPEPLLQSLLTHPGIRRVPLAVQALRRSDQGWQVHGLGREAAPLFQQVVLANAGGARELLSGLSQSCPKLAQGRKVGGQVSYYAARPGLPVAQAITASEGYWLPAVDGWHTAGSTYWPDAESVRVTDQGHADIRSKLKTFLDVNDASAVWQPAGGWAGWRAVVAGRLPAIGEIADAQGLWTACAFGSRGFTWAALAADVIAAAMLDEPQLLERDLLAAVRPR